MVVTTVHCGLLSLSFATFGLLSPPVKPGGAGGSPAFEAILNLDVQGCMGEAAVLIFFVISGFCISFPFRNGLRPHFFSYLMRRELRILPPCLSAIMLALLLNVSYFPLDHSNMWSIICEEIYYVLFPLVVLELRKRFSWEQLICTMHIAAAAIIISHPEIRQFHGFGASLTWLVGYPAWLWGCRLSSRVDALIASETVVPAWQVWLSRTAIGAYIAGSGLCNAYTPIGASISLSLFAPLISFWLSKEIAYGKSKTPPVVTEWCGKWSYTLYLIHLPLARWAMESLPHDWPPLAQLIGRLFVILAGSIAFYMLIEKPSHRWAQRIKMATTTVPVA